MIRVLISDLHACTRAGYRKFLSAHFPGAHLGEAVACQDILTQLGEQSWDLLMLDVEFVAQSKFRILRDVQSYHPTVRILVTSGLSDALWERRTLLAGAVGYLSKALPRQGVLDVVCRVLSRRIAEGKHRMQSGTRAAPAQEFEPPELHDCLSLREYQILCLLAKGKPLSEIASQLSISVKTVSTYRLRLLGKMGLTRNAQITQYALQNGLIAHGQMGELDRHRHARGGLLCAALPASRASLPPHEDANRP